MLTLPNLLTLSRIFAVPLLVFLLWEPGRYTWRSREVEVGRYREGTVSVHLVDSDRNELVLFDQHGHTAMPAADKLHLARQLISEIASRLRA